MVKEKEAKSRLQEAISHTFEILQTHRTSFAIRVPKPIPEKIQLVKQLIFAEFSEIVTLEKMTYERMDSFGTINQRMLELGKKLPSGTIDETTPEGTEYISLVNQFRKITAELTVLVKALYEWLYHLQELMQGHAEIWSLVPPGLRSKVQSECEFRNKLVAHKGRLHVFPLGGMKFSGGGESIELIMMPMSPDEVMSKELNGLYTKCAPHLPADEAGEQNLYEKCRVLARNMDKFPGQLRKEVISFVQKYGSISAEPVDLAELVRDLAASLVPTMATKPQRV